MKKITALLLAVGLCALLSACSGESASHARQTQGLAGPWHLDGGKNDASALEQAWERFPGYAEWGAGMEIRSNGQISWYIGAESWHGTYTLSGGVLHAQMMSDLRQEERSWDLRVTEEAGTALLEMDDAGMTICWRYGDREDGADGQE